MRVAGAPGEHPTGSSPARIHSFRSPRILTATASLSPSSGTRPIGVTTGSVLIASTDPTYKPTTFTVTCRVSNFGASTAPFGVFDTPTANAVVSGEIGVTGWAVDDIGIAGVDIFRSPLAGEGTQPNGLVFLGDATLVAGARSDVQAAYPTRPMSEKAGWGYMLLTNMLPGGGNGTFMLHAFARDVDGQAIN